MRQSKNDFTVTSDKYIRGGVQYDRVTTYCRPMGAYIPPSAKAAMERGERAHSYFKMINRGEWSKDSAEALRFQDPDMADLVEVFRKWHFDNVKKVYLCEKTIFNDRLMVAGTLDLFADLVGSLRALIDFKTGLFYKHYILQHGAYDRLVVEGTRYRPKSHMTVLVGLDGVKVRKHPQKHIEGGYRAWEGNLVFSRFLKTRL